MSNTRDSSIDARANNSSTSSFTPEHFAHLAENENFRYMPNSKRVGHAVLRKNQDGSKTAYQFHIPYTPGDGVPEIVPLTQITEVVRFGQTRYTGVAPDGKKMYAKRSVKAKMSKPNNVESDVDIEYFSETDKRDGSEPFWGSEKPIEFFRNDLSKRAQKDLKKELAEIKPHTKGGHELHIDPESVRWRDANRTRTPDQNTVMGESAQKAYEAFMSAMEDELSPDMRLVVKRAAGAPLKDMFKSNYRPEWLHAYGFSLTPKDQNPQTKDNLGAAGKWLNTEMMVLERIAKWFALNVQGVDISIKTQFDMLLDTELIKKIDFEVKIQDKNHYLRFIQELDAFRKWPLFRKASDLAQGAAIAFSLMNDIAPVSQQVVQGGSLKAPVITSTSITPIPTSSSVSLTGDSTMHGKKEKHQSKEKSAFPTSLNHAKSIVQVFTKSQEVEYDEPWNGIHHIDSSGTGFVVRVKNKNYILTNAHCVENSLITRIRLANDRKKKYEAKRVCVSYQCDLALLEIDDQEFNNAVEPVVLGEMVRLQDKVQTIGFPMGGNEISITKGIVSRIEVQDYAESGLDMLQVQVDSAINPGNSGGPVFSNGKVIGVAFQGYSSAQNLGYIIPMPVVNHFLKEALSGKEYHGFPIIPMVTQELRNPNLRKYYGLHENQSGIRVRSVDNLSDAYLKLKPNDILIEIDGYPISNEGTVDIPEIGNCIAFNHVTHMKFVGDSVALKILRKNAETKKVEKMTLDVILDRVPLETEIVGQSEFDKMPTYYINSGISFTPLTRNYLDGKGSDLESLFLMEDGCYLSDMPKKTLDQQLVVINAILDCQETEGYDSYENKLVKEVNGIKINNIRDVVRAMEANKKDLHEIETRGGSVIAVKNMSRDEHKVLLKQYKIRKDRSDDLPRRGELAEENVIAAPVPAPVITSTSTSTKKMQEALSIKEEKSHKESQKRKHQEIKPKPASREAKEAEQAMAHLTPGQRGFMATLERMEKVYAENPLDDEDDIADFNNDASTSDDESTSELSGSSKSTSDMTDSDDLDAVLSDNKSEKSGSNVHKLFADKQKTKQLEPPTKKRKFNQQ